MSELEVRTDTEQEASGPRGDAEAITTKERSQLQMVVARFFRHRLAVGSLVILLLIVAFAFIGPLVWQYDHTIHREIPSDQPPSLDHPFGTTRAGHDYMGQTMRGVQQTLKVGFVVALMVTGIGTLFGSIAGFYRGWVDAIIMRGVDILIIIPLLAVVLVLSSSLRGTTWWHVALIIGAFGWLSTSRVVRGMILSLREQEFIEAARAMGASDARIIGRHLVPNAIGVIIVDGTLVIAIAILVEATLSFIGFGITIPDTSLGLLIQSAQTAVFTRPWLFYIPGVFLIVIALTINFIGDGLRDALDPKQQVERR
jgi:peptide/nickel transport system permease protein